MTAPVRGMFAGRPYLYGVLAGGLTFIAVNVLYAAMSRYHLRPEATILDDVLLAGLAAVLVISLEKQHQREMRLQQQHLAMIIEMNHHIRNALQTIVYVSAGMKGDDVAKIRDATKRIEWALTEILPGEPTQHKTPVGHPAPRSPADH